MSIYDVFSGGSKPFDKEQWAAQKQAQRKEAYELIDNTCSEMMIIWALENSFGGAILFSLIVGIACVVYTVDNQSE